MANERGNGKTKKVVIGVATVVAVAAIAVPTALTLAGGKDNAGASNEGSNKYNIIVSSGIENVPDYSISIEKGTSVGTLKTMLKAIDGYTITGIYKDEAMQHPYSDEDTITSSTKIYIKFVAVTYTVNIYSEDGTTLLTTQEVSHKESLTLDTPTKPEDEFATYEFTGWVDETGNSVDLNEITSDLNIHPYFETHMKEYRIGFTNSNNTESISVSIGGEPVTLDSTYHYGSSIVIRATQNIGRDITEFKVNVGGTTTDVLTELYRHEEDGIVYYEIELTGNGDLSITYNEAASEYSLGNIPSQVTVKRNNKVLSSTDAIYYGDQLEISYRETEGYEKETFHIDGAELVGGVYVVKGNLTIEYTESKLAYTLGTIPSGVTVKSGDTVLSSNSTIYWGDELTFSYTTSSSRDTGATKQESGYHYREVETTTYSLTVNGKTVSSDGTVTAKSDLTLNLTNSSSTAWERGERVEYSLGTIPEGVTVTRNGETLSSNSVIYWGDVLTFTYNTTTSRLTGNKEIRQGYYYAETETIVNNLIANGTTLSSGRTLTAYGDVTIVLNSNTTTTWEKGEKVTFAEASWSDINEVAQSGYAAEVFSVGDEKDITLSDGEVLTMVVLGFNHDTLSDGTGKAKMSIGMKHLAKSFAKMNTSPTNAGGWEASAMRTTLNDYYNKLPDDLKSVIKAVNKDASSGNKSTDIVTSSDKLWLFSMAEIFSETAITTSAWSTISSYATTYNQEGSQYEYFRGLINDADPNYAVPALVRKLSNGSGNANWWWLRSPNVYGTNFLFVSNSGVINNHFYAIHDGGVSFGYCI